MTAVAATIWLAGALAAQIPDSSILSNDGVMRASAKVDSVFIDRRTSEVTIGGGDFGSYLMARLGVLPIPEDLKLRVAVDTQKILIYGRVGDLPELARQTLGPVLGIVPLETPVEAEVQLARTGPEVIVFHLAAVRVNQIPVPEGILAAVMYQIGRRYPVLGASGRDLYVQIPGDGEVSLVPGGVRLRTVPSPSSGRPRSPSEEEHRNGNPSSERWEPPVSFYRSSYDLRPHR